MILAYTSFKNLYLFGKFQHKSKGKPMKIGIIIGRIGGIDGVALETEKWIDVFKELGHDIFILSGELERPFPAVTLLPELAFNHPLTIQGQEDAFYQQNVDEDELLERLERETDYLVGEMNKWIQTNQLDYILSENASALPCHLTMGMAVQRIAESSDIQVITHDHDFPWERGERYNTRYKGIEEIIERCFPIKLPHVQHALINLYNQSQIKKRFNLDSTVVPNVMDFEQPYGLIDDYNRDLRQTLGLDPEDILLFQITRIVRRKGIEVAIELIHRLQDPKVKLVITGTAIDDHKSTYLNELQALSAKLGLEKQVLFAGEHFSTEREERHGKKLYSLYDAYAHARACTYFSTYEGFGNAFVEALVAKRAIFVNNYKPVYWPDIGVHGFKTVMLENNQLTDEALEDMKKMIYNPELCQEVADFNYQLGQKHFSYQVLAELLGQLFQ